MRANIPSSTSRRQACIRLIADTFLVVVKLTGDARACSTLWLDAVFLAITFGASVPRFAANQHQYPALQHRLKRTTLETRDRRRIL